MGKGRTSCDEYTIVRKQIEDENSPESGTGFGAVPI